MKIKQLCVTVCPATEQNEFDEWLYALCENGEITAARITDGFPKNHLDWFRIGEVPDALFGK